MDQQEKTFWDRVAEAAKKLGEFTVGELADQVQVGTKEEKRAVSAYVRKFVHLGLMARSDPDGPHLRSTGTRPCEERYRYTPKAARVTNRQRLWNVARRMPTPEFSLSELVQITGIPYDQCKRFCRWLREQKHAELLKPGQYRRIKAFGVAVPVDTKNSQRKIDYNQEVKRARIMAALDNAAAAIERAKEILDTD